ncbi:MAG TPA: DUF362 domain-containing protein [Candidatus Anaerotruncus excrementipullorum]|uniref:Ferredoxin n=1 Tax=Candidatus Anaerotruncus excrementipullorum TaxID=2838465 RepID=A0A9D1WRU0_9FIRM|nr:DUF362 domain-containing protein [Candidatus Anaerotruncus excrementipullorum]
MEKAKVYFTDMRTTFEENLPQKLTRLLKTAGIGQIDFRGKFVAIKIHFGELGNLAFLRPNYAKVVADLVKQLGGRPFLTDCNTLYVGHRKNALDHLDTAYENGFSPLSTGCQILIADGLKGTDEALVPVQGEYVREAKIGRAVMDADIVISLNHFKGHEQAGMGGALKNLGMGCGSRAGKMEMHSSGKPWVKEDRCIHCGACVKNCAHGAISFPEKKARIDQSKCVGCGRCVGVCPVDAVTPANDEAEEILSRKIAEYALAVVQGRPHFHVSLAIDISPYCDCHAENDAPIVPDVGMFASFDPVAIDQACADLVNAQPALPNSILAERQPDGDHFHTVHPITSWREAVTHGEKLGLGTSQYELIKI